MADQAKLFSWRIEVEIIDDDIFTKKASLFLNNWKMREFHGPCALPSAHNLSLQATPWEVTVIGKMEEYECQINETRRYTNGTTTKVLAKIGAEGNFLLCWSI